ncbi:MAG TPA: anti-sigma factor [Gemmatimonadales bacterium]|nr:anti-sigma factor [Gemmatimonadales bacterium]
MTCAEFRERLDAHVDGELPDAEAREMESHLAGCPDCAAACERHMALRSALREQLPPLAAPAELRASIVRAVGTSPRQSVFRARAYRTWSAAAAVLIGVIAGTWKLASDRTATDALTDALLSSHIRSLMGNHLTDVASSDQHTVKPWFNGKLDFSPPVSDFEGRGYPLTGGRLEYIGGQPVAALVYARRQHVINVFLWPTGRGPSSGPATLTRQGYHLLHWVEPDYVYWVVSDLGTTELDEFAGLLRQGAQAGEGR